MLYENENQLATSVVISTQPQIKIVREKIVPYIKKSTKKFLTDLDPKEIYINPEQS